MSQRILALAIVLTGLAGSAFAQTAPGPLLQPGEPYPGAEQEPIHLHPPVHKAPEETASPAGTSEASVAPESAAAPKIDLIHPPRHRRTAKPQIANVAPKSYGTETVPFSLDSNGQNLPPAQPSPVQPAPARAPAHPAAAPTRQASAAASSDHANLKKRGAILFEKGAPAPSPAQYRGVKVLADDLNAALEKGAAAIQLEAYGGAPGDKSSDARRLSLRRALAVRQLLIDDGVPSARIDVRAMGGSDDKSQPDRVDVFIRAG
jgi:outer membrane protein OmpA-like peptidoglycan-associated protein